MMPMPVSQQPESTFVTPSPTLPLRATALRVEAKGGLARVILEQTFENVHPDPLAVTYVLPLPADGAVSGFSFRVGDRRIEGEIDRKHAARERFEEAIAQGRTAAILEQERSSLFTQEIGNVPPGATVVCEIVIDQKLRWLEEGSWEWRFPLAAAPRYLGAPGRVDDAAKIALEVATGIAPRASLAMSILDALAAQRSPESPSHPLQLAKDGDAQRVELGGGNQAELDRDVVVRWPVARMEPSLSAFAERRKPAEDGDAFALLTLVPPNAEAKTESTSRDLVVLLDTSGSMGGAPLEQARRVSMALVDGLCDRDSIELVEFSNAPRRFTPCPIAATRENKTKATAWLQSLQASGGTEMREGILEALRPLRADAQRQVVIVTDGLIGFEQEIVKTILEKLPRGSRVHTVGVGSSVNRSLTGPAARAGRGVEIVLGLGEDPERAVTRLRARTEQPIVVDVTAEGSALLEIAPAKVPDLFAGSPVLIAARVRPEGGEIVLRGRTARGAFEQRVRVAPLESASGSTLSALFGREAVEDAETRLAAGAHKNEIDALVERLGLEHRIATRMTSWVAIDRTPSVDPRAPTRREVVPQQLPHGMSVEGLGLRGAPVPMKQAMMMPMQAVRGRMLGAPAPMGAPVAGGPPGFGAPPPPPAPGPMRPQAKLEADLDDEREITESYAARTTDAPPPPAAEARPSPPKAKKAQDRATLRGKIVLRKGREITIEVATWSAIDWSAEGVVFVTFDDGRAVRATVDASRTTTKSRLIVGQRARLVLVLDEDANAEVARVAFDDFDVEIG